MHSGRRVRSGSRGFIRAPVGVAGFIRVLLGSLGYDLVSTVSFVFSSVHSRLGVAVFFVVHVVSLACKKRSSGSFGFALDHSGAHRGLPGTRGFTLPGVGVAGFIRVRAG